MQKHNFNASIAIGGHFVLIIYSIIYSNKKLLLIVKNPKKTLYLCLLVLDVNQTKCLIKYMYLLISDLKASIAK